MCDKHTAKDAEAWLAKRKTITRRDFGAMAGSAAIALSLPLPANAAEVTSSRVDITTPDGVADCFFAHPSKGKAPGFIIWPDIVGLRPAFEAMGTRLAQSGYAVLVANPYYRMAKAPVAPEGASFRDQATRDIVLPLARSLSMETTERDAAAFAAYLDAQDAVDTQRGMGVSGYCMGGSMAFRTATHLPDRIRAVASFHGGRLVTDKEDSPHKMLSQSKADYLVAIAENDHERAPEAMPTLIEAFAQANLKAEVEVYEDAMHGWCPPDSAVYHEVQAERAWARLLALLESALK